MKNTFTEYPDTMNSEISYEEDPASDAEDETDTALEEETDTALEESEDTFNEDDADNEDDAENEEDYGDDDASEKNENNESVDSDCEYQYHEERQSEKEVIIPKEKRKCPDFLTKYEIARIIAIRSNQFEYGSPPAIEVKNIPRIIPSIDLAMIELYYQKTPFIIRRPIGINTFEEWKVSELRCTDLDFFKDVLKKYSII